MLDYSEASSSDTERRNKKQDRKGKSQDKTTDGKNKHKKGRKGKKDEEREDEDDRIIRQARERSQKVRDEDFAAFDDDEEDDEYVGHAQDYESQDDDQEELELPEILDPTKDYFKTLSKDMKLFSKRLEQLKECQNLPGLTADGKTFLKQYIKLLSSYLGHSCFYMLLVADSKDGHHPALRKLGQMRVIVKDFDKIWRGNKEAITLAMEAAAEEADLEGEEEMDIENAMDEEEFLDEEEDLTIKKKQKLVPHQASLTQNTNNIQKKFNSEKPKVKIQTFKLETPKSYSQIHQYIPSEDEEDDVLNLGKRKKAGIDDEITMDDLAGIGADGLLDEDSGNPKKKLIGSKKGKKLYDTLASKKTSNTQKANIEKEEEKEELNKYERKLMFKERRVGADEPRKITEEMILNPGLRRKRETKISKVKLREKAKKLELKNRVRKGLKKDNTVRDPHALSGIGEAVVRDVKLY